MSQILFLCHTFDAWILHICTKEVQPSTMTLGIVAGSSSSLERHYASCVAGAVANCLRKFTKEISKTRRNQESMTFTTSKEIEGFRHAIFPSSAAVISSYTALKVLRSRIVSMCFQACCYERYISFLYALVPDQRLSYVRRASVVFRLRVAAPLKGCHWVVLSSRSP